MILSKENLKLTNNAQKTAIGSFALGTLIFLLFYQTEIIALTLLGLLFLLIAIPLNLIYLFLLLRKVFTTDGFRNQIMITILMLLINIPVSYFYYMVAMGIADKVLAID